MKIKKLNELATEMVGDGKSPNIFFVTKAGNVVMITTLLQNAYTCWLNMPPGCESALEDRQYGTICDISPENDNSKRLHVSDGMKDFCRFKKISFRYLTLTNN